MLLPSCVPGTAPHPPPASPFPRDPRGILSFWQDSISHRCPFSIILNANNSRGTCVHVSEPAQGRTASMGYPNLGQLSWLMVFCFILRVRMNLRVMCLAVRNRVMPLGKGLATQGGGSSNTITAARSLTSYQSRGGVAWPPAVASSCPFQAFLGCPLLGHAVDSGFQNFLQSCFILLSSVMFKRPLATISRSRPW